MPYMPASSTEALYVDFDTDLTAYPVEVAVVLDDAGEPSDNDYHPAEWDGHAARLLIGAGSSLPLEPGEYAVWTRITAGDERPVRRSGVLTVGTP